ncbi:alpha/beta fold hydrolase [Rhizobium leguminosarum]|uniref:alpha/beta fold hydrolase n=1 Tax=Rhizobium leguminosarum TaxID=384 RepID=UPI00143F4116|nr:alpha/beta hydrolase [Rhizobium leguminosarum]NKL23389.1 alpha/beta fold hydrolase [Rhizobium leguminosarum bv. viciae]
MSLSPGQHIAAINGVNIAYTVSGSGPLLFAVSSGWGVGSSYLRHALAPLADRFTILVMSTRGSGGSSRPVDESTMGTATMADDIEHLRRHLGLGAIDLFGHSNGGAIAIGFAGKYPNACRKLILADSQLVGLSAGEATAAIVAERARDPRFSNAVAALSGMGPFVFEDQAITDVLTSTFPLYFFNPENVGKAIDTFDLPIDSWATRTHMTADRLPEARQDDLLDKIKARTLVLVGKDDFQTPVEISQHIVAGIRGAVFTVIRECGHMPWFEQPEIFYSAISEFLEG